MENIKLPYITGKTSEEKLNQLHKYIYQLVEQLNYNFGQKGNTEKSNKEEEEKANAFTNLYIGGTLTLGSMNDASGTSAPDGIPLVIGDSDGVHLEVDNNEIMAKSTDTTTNTLFLNHDGGNVQIGNNTLTGQNERFVISNSNGTMYNIVNSDGDMGLYDATNSKYIIRKYASDGSVQVDGQTIKASAGYNVTADGNLSSGSDSYLPTTSAVVGYLRSHLKSGRTSEITVGGSAATSATSVSFGTAFGSTPRVELTMENTGTFGYGLGSMEVYITAVSASGFSYRIANNNSSERKVRIHWVATDMGNN